MNTVASSNIRSRAHNREESSLKNSPHLSGPLLLVNIIVFGPSLLYLRSMTSKNIRVFSLSKTHLPISSMIRQDGFTRPFMVLLSRLYFRASVKRWFHSVAFKKYAFRPFWQHLRPYAIARCVFPTPGGPMNARFLCA